MKLGNTDHLNYDSFIVNRFTDPISRLKVFNFPFSNSQIKIEFYFIFMNVLKIHVFMCLSTFKSGRSFILFCYFPDPTSHSFYSEMIRFL
jgi:hypothetical protein